MYTIDHLSIDGFMNKRQLYDYIYNCYNQQIYVTRTSDTVRRVIQSDPFIHVYSWTENRNIVVEQLKEGWMLLGNFDIWNCSKLGNYFEDIICKFIKDRDIITSYIRGELRHCDCVECIDEMSSIVYRFLQANDGAIYVFISCNDFIEKLQFPWKPLYDDIINAFTKCDDIISFEDLQIKWKNDILHHKSLENAKIVANKYLIPDISPLIQSFL